MTAIFWTIMGVLFESAGKKVGSLAVNFIRLVTGFTMLSIFVYFYRGYLLPTDASPHNWTWLGVSGFVGFFVADLFLFQAYLEIGTRISMLILALGPPMTAILGYFILGEKLSAMGILGMIITVSGIAIVILSKDKGENKFKVTHSIKGITYAFLGAVGNSVGMILTKIGMGDYSPFAATQIRIITGFIGFVIIFAYLNKWDDLKKAFADKKAMAYITLGSLFGPFLGVSFQLISLQYTTAGISSTITSIMPVTILPFSVFVFKEKLKPKEILGALISVVGVGILFLI
ncbi:MAG: DMT family transporter [Tissierella sp.]|nr:DMT family transporter [Tissierella sp.]